MKMRFSTEMPVNLYHYSEASINTAIEERLSISNHYVISDRRNNVFKFEHFDKLRAESRTDFYATDGTIELIMDGNKAQLLAVYAVSCTGYFTILIIVAIIGIFLSHPFSLFTIVVVSSFLYDISRVNKGFKKILTDILDTCNYNL
jgi:hypothetical protein